MNYGFFEDSDGKRSEIGTLSEEAIAKALNQMPNGGKVFRLVSGTELLEILHMILLKASPATKYLYDKYGVMSYRGCPVEPIE